MINPREILAHFKSPPYVDAQSTAKFSLPQNYTHHAHNSLESTVTMFACWSLFQVSLVQLRSSASSCSGKMPSGNTKGTKTYYCIRLATSALISGKHSTDSLILLKLLYLLILSTQLVFDHMYT